MEKDQIQFLIEQKLSVMNAVGGVTMSWWTTSIVFCLTSIGVAWLYRNKIEQRYLTAGFATVLVVFVLLAAYGILVYAYLGHVHSELSDLAQQYGAPSNPFTSEVEFFQRAMITAIIDFSVLTFVWIILYIYLRCQPRHKDASLDILSDP